MPLLASLTFSRTPPSGQRSHHAACCQGGLECAGAAAVGVLDALTNALRQGIDHTTQLAVQGGLESAVGVLTFSRPPVRASITPRSLLSMDSSALALPLLASLTFSRTLSVRASITPRSLLSKADSSAGVAAVGVLDVLTNALRQGNDHTTQLVVQGGLECAGKVAVVGVLDVLNERSSGHRSHHAACCQGGLGALALPLLASLTFSRTRLSGHRSHHAACCQGGLECAGVALLASLTFSRTLSVRASITPRSFSCCPRRTRVRWRCRCWRP